MDDLFIFLLPSSRSKLTNV